MLIFIGMTNFLSKKFELSYISEHEFCFTNNLFFMQNEIWKETST